MNTAESCFFVPKELRIWFSSHSEGTGGGPSATAAAQGPGPRLPASCAPHTLLHYLPWPGVSLKPGDCDPEERK